MPRPIFLQRKRVYEIFEEIERSIPTGSELFLLGGALRNSVYYHFFEKKMRQRDYDLIFMGNRRKFTGELKKLGFTYGKIRRRNQVVFKKPLVKNPQNVEDYAVLDISFYPQDDIRGILKKKVNFTINGFALDVRKSLKDDWMQKMVTLPHAIEDIRAKQLRLNTEKKNPFGSDLYACIRFMSAGFKKPAKEEVDLLLRAIRKMPKHKFERNKEKVFDYVGGREKAERIAKKLGMDRDIFSSNILLES